VAPDAYTELGLPRHASQVPLLGEDRSGHREHDTIKGKCVRCPMRVQTGMGSGVGQVHPSVAVSYGEEKSDGGL
jgi:hypothetical protein